MQASGLQLGMLTAAALVGGGGVGWWLRGRYNWTQRVIMDELWTRKIKSFEATSVAAQEAQALSATVESEARARMQNAEQHAAQLEHELEQSGARERRLESELEALREELAQAARGRARLEAELLAQRKSRQVDAERLAKLQRRAKSLAVYPPRLEERETELARLEVRMAEFAEEKNAEITRLTDWIAELTPLTETLRQRGEELAALQRARRKDEACAREREEALRRELATREAALKKYGQRHQQLRDERDREHERCEQAVRARRALEQRLGSLRDARAQLETSLEQARAEFTQARQEAIQGRQRITELQVDLRTAQARVEQLAAAHEQLVATGAADRARALELHRQLEKAQRKLAAPTESHGKGADSKSPGKERRAAAELSAKRPRGPVLEGELFARGSTLKKPARVAADAQPAADKPVRPEAPTPKSASSKAMSSKAMSSKAMSSKAMSSKAISTQPAPAKDKAATQSSATPSPGATATETAPTKSAAATKAAPAKSSAPKRPPSRPSPSKAASPKAASPKGAPSKATEPKSSKSKPTQAAPSRTTSTKPARAPRRDDLTRIKGIGDKVAAKLESAGCATFASLAGLKGARLEKLAREIAVPLKRIQREGWIDAARKLR